MSKRFNLLKIKLILIGNVLWWMTIQLMEVGQPFRKFLKVIQGYQFINVQVIGKRGLTRAEITELKTLQGKYTAFLDSDDCFLPNHLARKLEYLESNQVDGVFGSVFAQTNEGGKVFVRRPLCHNEKMINYLLGSGFAPTPTFFFKRSAIEKIKWDESLQRHQDIDLCVRFTKEYKLIPDEEITVTINWVNLYDKKIDFNSCIRVIERYKTEIAPSVYRSYSNHMYHEAKKFHADKKTIKHYKRERFSNPSSLNFEEYLTLTNTKKGLLNKVKNILMFFYIVFKSMI